MEPRDRLTRMALRLGPAILVLVTFAAILSGVLFHAISIDELKFRSPPVKHFDNNVIIDDKLDNNLIWFLQVTDLHLSNRGDFGRQTDFNEFAKNYVDIIQPDVVLVTGDITDGRIPNTTLGTTQQLDEWLAYSGAVSRSGALEKTTWLDIRGNHDNFNVYRPKDPNVMYRQYSVMGKSHERNYMKIYDKGGKKYSFIGVDEVQTPGLKIPFNFIGVVKDEDLTELKQFKEESTKNDSQYNIWFAHYPTSSIASPNEGLRNIIDGPYLCGHFHTIGNWVSKMHATQQPGYAEVELGDWKYNRRIRLASVDHQLFSLVDVSFNQFPIALMTNPKTAEHSMPKFEPLGRIANSTHMRVLAFSNVTINKVEISIDGGSRKEMTLSQRPLYTLPWNPKDYSTGLHTADIYVSDKEGKSMKYSQKFSLDLTKEQFPVGARILLRAYFKSYVMAIFYFIVTVCTLPPLALRFIVYRHHESGLKRHYKGSLLYKFHILANVDRIFWPLFIVPIWMALGPHFIGRLVDEAIGACFVWGVLIDGTFIHTGITYNVGSIFILLIHVPVSILLTYQVSNTYDCLKKIGTRTSIVNVKLLAHLLITLLQLYMGHLLLSAYGTMSYLTSFPFVWCLFIYAYCWYQCTKLEKSDFIRFDGSDEDSEERQSFAPGQTGAGSSSSGGAGIINDKSSNSGESTC